MTIDKDHTLVMYECEFHIPAILRWAAITEMLSANTRARTMQGHDFLVTFIAESDVDAGAAAREFAAFLTQSGTGANLISDNETQDFGVVVGIILGSAAIVEIARGIADYVRRYNVSDVEVVGKRTTVRISNVKSADLDEIVTKLTEAVR